MVTLCFLQFFPPYNQKIMSGNKHIWSGYRQGSHFLNFPTKCYEHNLFQQFMTRSCMFINAISFIRQKRKFSVIQPETLPKVRYLMHETLYKVLWGHIIFIWLCQSTWHPCDPPLLISTDPELTLGGYLKRFIISPNREKPLWQKGDEWVQSCITNSEIALR